MSKFIKILTLGNSMVGKSSLILRYIENKFYDTYISTIGVDCRKKKIQIDNEDVNLQIWDSAGQEKYRAISSQYFRKAHGIFLVYDVSSRTTFESISQWYTDIQTETGKGIPIVLVGNKCDIMQRDVLYEEASKFANKKDLCYFETSALTGTNVSEAFGKLAEMAWEYKTNIPGRLSERSGVTLKAKKKKKNCCS